MFHVSLRSKDAQEDSSWSATPNNSLVQRLHSLNETMRWIAVVQSQGEEHRIALGSPDGQLGGYCLTMPEWFLESSGLSSHANADEVIVRFIPCEGIPSARKLRFKTLEPLPDWLDIRDVIEEPLSQLGIIKQGQMIPLPVLDSVVLILDSAEPFDDFLFLDGDDIEIDVVTDEVPEAYAPETPEAPEAHEAPYAAETPEDAEPAFPFFPSPPAYIPPSQGFVAFSGKGHTLGTGKPVWDSKS
jgi:hypothetical protein